MTTRPLAWLPALLKRDLVTVTVRGASMEPTYRDGNQVLVRRDLPPCSGLIVVVERPVNGLHWHDPPVPRSGGGPVLSRRAWMIKRVAAVGGDPLPRNQFPALTGVPEDKVPPEMLVLRGDNANASYDSRQAGYFPAERVLGVVWDVFAKHR